MTCTVLVLVDLYGIMFNDLYGNIDKVDEDGVVLDHGGLLPG